MADLLGSIPFQLAMFQQEYLYRPSKSTPSVESSTSSHSIESATLYHSPQNMTSAHSIYDSASYGPTLGLDSLPRPESATSGESENPTPSSSGYEYQSSASHLVQPSQRERMIPDSLSRQRSRRRTTPEQLKLLEAHFAEKPKPDVGLRKELADQLSMTPREVQVWFQNRRAKAKKLAKRAEDEAEQDALREEYPEHEQAPVSSYQALPWQPMPLGNTRVPLSAGPSLYTEGWRSNNWRVPSTGRLPENWAMPAEASADLLVTSLLPMAQDVSPLSTASPLPGDVTRLQLPLLPRVEPSTTESGPSSSSSVFTNFAFGDAAARRGSAASIESLLTETSETGTVSGTLTPLSMAGSGASFDGLLPPGFDATRRSSCPADLIAHFQDANLSHAMPPSNGNPVWLLEQLAAPQPMRLAGHSLQSLSAASQHPHLALMSNLGRRHSVAVDSQFSRLPNDAAMSVGNLSPSRHVSRRSSVAANLDPIAEYGTLPPSPSNGFGALRRAPLARKSRSQASMRAQLVRPSSALSDGTLPITSSPQFDS